ncbi:MAG TPA: hypothetical protein VF516_33025 [Kofleriaceae bacterium]
MGSVTRVLMAVLLLAPVGLAAAPPDADPSGHWEGTIQAPNRSVAFEIDLGKNARGELIGTFGSPAQGEKGLPLGTIAVTGREVRFAVNATSGGGMFHATLRDDGRAMAGDFTLARGGQSVPFQLTRTGDARFTPPPTSPPISKRLEGRWTGTLTVDGKHLTIGLAMANQPDGTATGTVRSDGLQLPIAIAERGARLRIEVPSVGASFAGEIDAAGTRLVGTWSQRTLSLPLTFARDAK